MTDFHMVGGIKPALLAEIIRDGGGQAPQIARILRAAVDGGFFPPFPDAFLEGIQAGYAERFALGFAEAGYESVADGAS